MYNLAIALYWSKLLALVAGLLASVELLDASPLVSIFLYFIFSELSGLFMSIAIKGLTDGTDSQ